MRVLVLQLARFGDIFQTWPTLNALARGGAEVHVLVRKRFAAAAFPFANVHVLDAADVLEPILSTVDVDESHRRLRASLDALAALKFDHVVNLSFSPFSSHVAEDLAESGARVSGYRRHADGFFNPADDVSAYFYAQAGVGGPARFHVTELFAAVAGVELEPSDFRTPFDESPRAGVVVQLGSSDQVKTYPPELWAEALREFRLKHDASVTLVGSRDERDLAAAVAARANIPNLINRAGETTIEDLARLIARAELVISGDSASIHVAALTGTPVLNISCAAANFWETGPLTPKSRVLFNERVHDVDPERVAAEAASLLADEPPAGPCFVRTSEGYEAHQTTPAAEFEWRLIQALYVGTPYPEAETLADRLAFQRLRELAELASSQLALWPRADHATLAAVDEMLKNVPQIHPRVRPLTQHFETERTRIGPDADVLAATKSAFENLALIASVFLKDEPDEVVVARAIDLGAEIAPSLREFAFSDVEVRFNDLVGTLHELARRSTKVQRWADELEGITNALAERDLIELADRLEHDLPRRLKSFEPEVS